MTCVCARVVKVFINNFISAMYGLIESHGHIILYGQGNLTSNAVLILRRWEFCNFSTAEMLCNIYSRNFNLISISDLVQSRRMFFVLFFFFFLILKNSIYISMYTTHYAILSVDIKSNDFILKKSTTETLKHFVRNGYINYKMQIKINFETFLRLPFTLKRTHFYLFSSLHFHKEYLTQFL